MVAKDGSEGHPDTELGGEGHMLMIPFDGPSIEGKRAVVSTAAGMFKGIVMRFDRDGLDLAIDGKVKQFDGRDVRSIAAA
jgi:hypothetical protein